MKGAYRLRLARVCEQREAWQGMHKLFYPHPLL